MATPTWEALIFGANRRATFLPACVFARIIDATDFFIIPAKILFRRDHCNGTIVLHAFPPVSSRRWVGAKSKFVCFVMLLWTLARASLRHRQDAACAGRFVQCLQPTLECRSALESFHRRDFLQE